MPPECVVGRVSAYTQDAASVCYAELAAYTAQHSLGLFPMRPKLHAPFLQYSGSIGYFLWISQLRFQKK